MLKENICKLSFSVYDFFIAMIRNRGFRLLVAFFLFVVVTILVVTFMGYAREHTRMMNPVQARASGQPMPVSSVPAKHRQLQAITGAECITFPSSSAVISSIANAKVIRLHATEGQSVEKDQLLVELDDSWLRRILDNARRGQRTAEEQKKYMESYLDDLKRLEKKSLLPIVDMLRARGDIAEARRVLTKINEDIIHTEKALSETTLTSPISGVISESNIVNGVIAKANERMVVIDQMNPIKLECEFAENAVSRILKQDRAEVKFVSFPDEKMDATFRHMIPGETQRGRIDNNQTLRAIFEMPNQKRKYVKGMHAIIQLKQAVEGITIPTIAILNRQSDEAEVFAINDDEKVELRTVKIGAYANGYVNVVSGIVEHERVVVAGQIQLHDGDSVRDNASH